MANYWVVRADVDIRDSVEAGGFIGIGFGGSQLGNLSGLSREQIRERVVSVNPNSSPNQIGSDVGQLDLFVNAIKDHDRVFTPIQDRKILIGEIAENYVFLVSEPQPHRRKVNWRATVSRDDFSDPLKGSTGSNKTVFSITKHANEIEQMLGNQVGQGGINLTDLDPLDIDSKARQQILNFLVEKYPEHQFEELVGYVLGAMGFKVEGHGPGADSGVDLIAKQGLFDFDRIIVQVKNQKPPVGNSAVRNLRGTRESGRKLFVSASGYTRAGREEAGTDIRLLNGLQLVDLLIEHYDKLPSEFRARVPLKPVYLLAPTDEESE